MWLMKKGNSRWCSGKNTKRAKKKLDGTHCKCFDTKLDVLSTNQNSDNLEQVKQLVITQLKTVYDPEFPLVDLYTLGLIYDIQVFSSSKDVEEFFCASGEKQKWKEYTEANFPLIVIVMTFTTPMCPMWDMLVQMVKNAVLEKLPDRNVHVEVVFDPLWKVTMIKDEDVRKIFEQ